jgi:hypothetical protein
MTPISPVIPWEPAAPVVTFAENQPQYRPLPAIQCGDENGTIVTRWRLTWPERLRVLLTGDMWLTVMTFGHPLQPLQPACVCPFERTQKQRLWHLFRARVD